MGRLSRDQEEELMKSVMQDPRVLAASRALQNVDHCNDAADRVAHNRFEQAVSNAVTRENTEHRYGMTAAQRAQFADILVGMSVEDSHNSCSVARPPAQRRR